MSNSKVAEILEKNDRLGEQSIAFIQSFMAVIILILHLTSAVQNNWVTFNLGTILSITLIITSSLYRMMLTQAETFQPGKFLFLTVVDGLLIFLLLLSYNVAYKLELAAIFKSPSVVLFVIYTAAQLVRFDPKPVLVAGGTVIGGWAALFATTYFYGDNIATNYTEYLVSQKLLVGAAFEMAVGYCCFLGILAVVTAGARRFLARTATVEELEVANRKAEENAANFENLYSSSTDGIIIVDTAGIIIRINPAISKIFGYESEDLIGQSTALLMSEENSEALKLGIEQYLNSGYSGLVGASFESAGLHKDGYQVDIELSITEFSAFGEIRFAGFIRDIKSRKLAELNEKRAQAQFQSAVDAAMDAIVIIDEHGCVTGYNPAAEEIFGFTQTEIMGRKLSETIIPERYREAHENGMKQSLKTGLGLAMNTPIEIQGLHASGSELQIELVIREIDGISGKRFFGYARDITERKHNEEMLIRAKDEAEVATGAKARFLAIMSHEIRTALNGVLGVVGLLGDTCLNDEQKKLIGVAEESGRSLLGIINDILDFSKLEAGKFQIEANPFRLQLLMQSIRDLVEPQAEKKGLLFECIVEEKLDRVFNGDADRIRQVLLNLIWNALKFTDNGQITVHVGMTGDDENPIIRFAVDDTGVGVPDHKKDQLFAEFATITHGQQGDFQGTGLGLAISKAFVEAMDGSIGFESKSKNGSVFWFDVPLEFGREELLQNNTAVVYSPSFCGLSGIRVLVVDDNLTNQLIVKRYLSKAGCQVDVANNGMEAVEQYHKGRQDLVLMDISMPEMNGYEATAAIRFLDDDGKSVPIVAFTAYATEDDKSRIKTAGMDDHVTKPFSRDHLINTIVKHLPHLASQENLDTKTGDGSSELIDEIARNLDLDHVTLASTLTGMDDTAIGEIIGQFSVDLARYLELARAGLKSGDWDKLEQASHGLKGASGMFGALDLRDLSGRVNTMCRNGLQGNIKGEAKRLIEQTENLVNLDAGDAAQKLTHTGVGN